MVKSKKQASKKGSDVEVEHSTEVNNEEAEDTSQENGVEDVSAQKKITKGKGKEKKEKSEEDPTEKEETDDIVENGEEKSDKKKTPSKASKKPPKKESKPHVEPARKSSRTPKPVTKEGNSETSYEVDKIIDFRLDRGYPQYLVRWKGYTKADDTWEDERDLNCPELLQKFKSDNPGSAKKRPSKSPTKSSAAKKTKKVEKDYEVEEIVGLRIKNGKKEFKIRWKGYKESDDSWEPEKHLSCQDLIEQYLEEHADEVEKEEKKTPVKKTVKKAKTPAKSAKGKRTKRK